MGGVGRKLWLDGANSFRVWEWFLLLLWKRDFFLDLPFLLEKLLQ